MSPAVTAPHGAAHPAPLAPDAAQAPGPPVFVARGLTKVYHMGDVDVHALRGVDLDL